MNKLRIISLVAALISFVAACGSMWVAHQTRALLAHRCTPYRDGMTIEPGQCIEFVPVPLGVGDPKI